MHTAHIWLEAGGIGGGDRVAEHGDGIAVQHGYAVYNVLRKAGVEYYKLSSLYNPLPTANELHVHFLQYRHIRQGNVHFAVVIQHGYVGRGGMIFHYHALAHVYARGGGVIPYHASVNIAAKGRDEPYAAAQTGKVF